MNRIMKILDKDLAPKVWKQLAHKKSLQSSRKPIKSMAAVSRDRLMDAVSLGDVILRDLKLNSIITDTTDYKYPMEYDKRNDIHSYYLDIRGFGEIKVLVKQDDYRTNRRNGSYSIELSPLGGGNGDKFKNFENTYYEGNGRDEFNADWNDILSQMISMDNVMTQMNSSHKPVKSSLNLTDVFYDLCEDGYIYEEDENGYNMSYGEYMAISDYMWEKVEEELEQYRDFESAYEAFQDIVNSADDDTKMFWGYSDDDDFYFYADYDDGTYSTSGECPDVLKDRFKEFQQNTELERR